MTPRNAPTVHPAPRLVVPDGRRTPLSSRRPTWLCSAAPILVGGAVTLWSDRKTEKRRIFNAGPGRFATTTYAILRHVHVDATVNRTPSTRSQLARAGERHPADADTPLFVGVGPRRLAAYLDASVRLVAARGPPFGVI